VSAPSSNEITVNGVTIRRLRPAEAAGGAGLVTLVYGDSYYPRDLYDPEQIVRLNEAGRLVSIVALGPAGDVVGHYALERPHLAAVAEASDAIVRPEHRHHHVLEQMRLLLRAEAVREGLTGLVGYAVTNHLFTQKAEERFGAHPCGVALGLWPRSFHNMPEPLTQRMSFAIYFNFLRPPGPVRHVATCHQDIISRIYRQYDTSVDLSEDVPAEGRGEIDVEYEAAVTTGTIRVRRVGADTAAAVRRACRDLCEGPGAKALTLELPLAQAGTGAVCRTAEEEGFFFSGLGPAFAGDGDALILQLPTEDIDPSLLQIDRPFAKDLLAYVDGERARVGKTRRC
jgi:serine/threonine-protein kinase RsbW